MRSLACALAAVLMVPAPALAEGPGVVFRVDDPRITESSGLVDTGPAMFTVNDSGNDAVLFRLDPRTGRTTETIRFADEAVDVEALAPGRRGEIWVGDIGDNARQRQTIELYRVRTGTGEVERRRLRYPDGPHDAETLLVARDGSVHVVTKELLGGRVYTARPGRERLRRGPAVGAFLTDGALMPDQRHVLLRTYGQLFVHTYPSFDLVGTMRLPRQPQGEGISVGPGGRIRISSEGAGQPVRQVGLTLELVRRMTPSPAQPSPAPAPATPTQGRPGAQDDSAKDPWPAWGRAGALLGVLGLGLAAVLAWRRGRANRA